MSAEFPPTTASVILKTNYGELEVQLWTKECPKTCKNFIQQCLEGYYNDTIFHRLIPGFLIQGGDPSNTGQGGESIYSKPFVDEFNLRLKYSHRGLVGMATTIPNDNRSQFFITFDAAESQYKKHTLFGRITGDTIYNLLAMEKLDLDRNDRPLTPPVIQSTQVILNPFTDIFVRDSHYLRNKNNQLANNQDQTGNLSQTQKDHTEIDTKKRFQKKKIDKKNTKLLSFQNDDDDDETSSDDNNDKSKLV